MTKIGGTVLIVDDEGEICQALATLVQREGWRPTVAPSGEAALAKIRSERPDVLLVDWKLPDTDGMDIMRRAKALDDDLPVILITGYAEVRGAVEAIQAGAHDYLAKPFDHAEVIRVLLRAMGERELKRKLKNLSSQIQQRGSLRETFGPSDATGSLISQVERVAKSNFSVLILGETGSGKELVARAIHEASLRSKGPYIPVDCGAIPDTLLESELFGHEKGAFTGASTQQRGKFEAARGGTLFLDEISNMALGSQAKLLRVLQEKVVLRIGATRPFEVDVRVLAASNQDLQAASESGPFRQDLYFRLNEFAIRVPPLRERREDILYLAKRFLDITNVELEKDVSGFADSALEVLLACHWPGNVRQLRSTIRRAVLLADGVITERHLDVASLRGKHVRERAPFASDPSDTSGADCPLREIVRRNTMRVEREVIAQTLRRTGGNKARAARLLQIDYKTMHSKVKEYGIAMSGKENYGQEEQ